MNQPTFQTLLPPPPQNAADSEVVLDFGRIFSILRHGWWIIAGAGFSGALVAAIAVMQVEPTYRAQAQLLMGKTSRTGDVLGALVQDLNLDDDAIAGEIAIITSGRLLSQVSTRLNLSSRPEFNSELRPPQAEPALPAKLLDAAVEQAKQLIGAGPPPLPETPAAPADGEAAGIDPIGASARLGEASLGDQGAFVGQLISGLRVSRAGNTDLVDVRFTSTDPALAAAIANAVVDTYLEDQLSRKFAALRRLTEGLETRLANMRQRLEASERAVIEYRTEQLAEGFAELAQLNNRLTDLTRRLGQAVADQAEEDSELSSIDDIIAERGATGAAGLFGSQLIERMRSQIIELRQRQGALGDRSGDNATAMRNVEQEIARLEGMIGAEVMRLRDDQANRVELGRARVRALSDELHRLERLAILQAEQEVTLAQLERDQAAQRAVYGTFLDKFTETSETLDLQEGDAQVIAYASPPSGPVAPNKKAAVGLGGIAGGFAGIGIVFVLALTDNRIRSKAHLASMLPGAPVIALPRARKFTLRSFDPLAEGAGRTQTPFAEGVRLIRSQLMLSEKKGPGRIVGVTSLRAEAGKTEAGILLARSIAQMGLSCVVVDADLREAGIANRLSLRSRPDLVDVLRGESSLDAALQDDPASTAQILAARGGVTDPAGVLLTDAMGSLIIELRQMFRVVIINAAPLIPETDAAPMIKICDNLVLVVRYGSPEQEVEAGLDTLAGLSVPQVSIALSMAPPRFAKSYGRYDTA